MHRSRLICVCANFPISVRDAHESGQFVIHLTLCTVHVHTLYLVPLGADGNCCCFHPPEPHPRDLVFQGSSNLKLRMFRVCQKTHRTSCRTSYMTSAAWSTMQYQITRIYSLRFAWPTLDETYPNSRMTRMVLSKLVSTHTIMEALAFLGKLKRR